MPRVRSSTSDPYDFCRECFPSEEEALAVFGNVGDGPDGRGNCFAYEDDHPDYGYGYACYDCKRELHEETDR